MINIILGPPGTGKTTKLLEICQQKKEQGIAWDKIGFFSFSRKAANEARDRARLKFQASKDDLVHFRTLHSFAFRHLPVNEDHLMKQKHDAFFGIVPRTLCGNSDSVYIYIYIYIYIYTC